MRWRLLAVLGLCASVVGAEARTVETFKIGGWRGSALVNNADGRFDSCLAIARYRSNISMTIQVDGSFGWWMGFSSPDWNMKAGDKIDLRYRIDQSPWKRGIAKAASPKLARLPMPAGGYIITQFRKGKLLTVDDNYSTYRFRLANTSALLARLATCVEKNIGIYGSAAAADIKKRNAASNGLRMAPANGRTVRDPALIIEASQALFNLMGHLGLRDINLKNEKSRKRNLKGIHAVASNRNRTVVAHIFKRGSYKSEKSVLTRVIAEAAKNCDGDFSSGTGSDRRDGTDVVYGHSNCRSSNMEVNELYAIAQRKGGGLYAYGISDRKPGSLDQQPVQVGDRGQESEISANRFHDAVRRSGP